jgi:hypothetical protein
VTEPGEECLLRCSELLQRAIVGDVAFVIREVMLDLQLVLAEPDWRGPIPSAPR